MGLRAETRGGQTRESETARVQIIIQSRNASAVLAAVMERLHALGENSEFRDVLSIDKGSEAIDTCAKGARRDPSGRVFDLAQCVNAWPVGEKANFELRFERTFAKAVRRNGAYGFPAVRVAPFEYELRLQSTQFPRGLIGEPFLLTTSDELQPTESFMKILCDPAVTFVEGADCEKNVRVVPRLGVYQPDIYVPHTGYRVELTRPMRPDLATNLRAAVLRKLSVPDASPSALRISVFSASKAKPEQLAAEEQAGRVNTVNEISKLWGSIGAQVDSIDVAAPGEAAPPTFLLFDSKELNAPISIASWLAGLKFSAKSAATCPPDPADHTDAVTGMLFPQALIRKLTGSGDGTVSRKSEWGFILGPEHFKGLRVGEGGPWYRRQVFAKPGDPIVALTVFSEKYESDLQGAAQNAAQSYLADASNLLVVATAQRKRLPKTSEFRTDADLTSDAGALEDFCGNKAWPACLGRHPRVMVVGPAEYPGTEQSASVFQPSDYYLGASTVRMLAPGGKLPVLARCDVGANAANRAWQISWDSGTSYAAPMVALVTARLLQIGPAKLRRELPEAAFWRILATTSALEVPQGSEATPPAQFGRLNAGKALTGARERESGPNHAAVLYESDGDGKETMSFSVVLPYPWMDQATLQTTAAAKHKTNLPRGVLTLTTPKGTAAAERQTIEFHRLLRIVRRTVQDQQGSGSPLFDVYYVKGNDLKSVAVKRRVRLGSGDLVEVEGFCRTNGQPLEAENPNILRQQAQPACLYAWRAGSPGFEPLDLSRVRDIVFPLLHFGAPPAQGIASSDLKGMTARGSPWREQVCRTGPRIGARKFLAAFTQTKLYELCGQ